jgi:hypothetical protein
MFDREDEQTLLEKVEKLKASLVSYATQGAGGLEIADFMRLRQEIMKPPRIVSLGGLKSPLTSQAYVIRFLS